MRPAVFPINLVGPWCMGTYIVPNILFSCELAAGACLAMCWRISLIRHLLWLCSLCGFSRLLRLQIYFSILLTLVGSQTHVSTVLGKYFHWNSFSDGAGWRPLAWLVSAHKVTTETSLLCLILAQGTHHQFPSSSFCDEFNQVIFKGNFSFRVFEFDSVIFYLFLSLGWNFWCNIILRRTGLTKGNQLFFGFRASSSHRYCGFFFSVCDKQISLKLTMVCV